MTAALDSPDDNDAFAAKRRLERLNCVASIFQHSPQKFHVMLLIKPDALYKRTGAK